VDSTQNNSGRNEKPYARVPINYNHESPNETCTNGTDISWPN